jgi:glycosyltransferase involved in cell wall biosynthesis
MKVAVAYDRIETQGPEVFGLQVAVRDWLRAYLRYATQEKFFFLIKSKEALTEIEEAARAVGIDPSRIEALDSRFPQANFEDIDLVFRTDSSAEHLLWQRELLKSQGYAFCGLSHTIAGLESGRELETYCLAPSEIGDAIVCPSQSIQLVIQNYWNSYEGYLNARFGAVYRCPVDLPILPLGIDIDRIERATGPQKRAEQRQKLGLAEDEIAVLWVGRLSSILKAHPLPMFQAVEEAAKKSGKKIRFLMQGYFFPKESEGEYRDLAKDICHESKVDFIASDDPRFPDGLWAAGDIFLSLVDNIQESFGLTPIEAIAAGLPRVISDWDGYRESVNHGEDGFLVPTTQPPSGEGSEVSQVLLGGREIYGGYLAKTSLCAAVDATAATEALAKLATDPELRRKMAENARKRLPTYDWKNIIPAYEKLWASLIAKRRAAVQGKARLAWPAIPPQAPDPFTMYESFPTAPLAPNDRLQVIATADEIRLLWKHKMNLMAMDMLPHPDKITSLIQWLSQNKDARISDALNKFREVPAPQLWRCVAWLLKLGILRLV